MVSQRSTEGSDVQIPDGDVRGMRQRGTRARSRAGPSRLRLRQATAATGAGATGGGVHQGERVVLLAATGVGEDVHRYLRQRDQWKERIGVRSGRIASGSRRQRLQAAID